MQLNPNADIRNMNQKRTQDQLEALRKQAFQLYKSGDRGPEYSRVWREYRGLFERYAAAFFPKLG